MIAVSFFNDGNDILAFQMMALFFKKWIIALTIGGVVLILLIWYLLQDPTELDWSDSLVKPNADYSIMTPLVLPKHTSDFVFLLVIVSSAPTGDSVERRKAIRGTWGKPSSNYERQWRVIFMTGKGGDEISNKKLFQESKQYGDLLICDYKDSYDKILNKLLTAYDWAANLQSIYRFQYVLKTDDDVYVNVPRLYQWIDSVGSKREQLYAGVLYAGIVNRDKDHRHYVREEDVPYNYYPPFCKGSMLVVSSPLLPKITSLSRKMKRIVPDDAYVGLIMNELGVKATRIGGFVQHALMPYILTSIAMCNFKNVIGLGDSLTPQQIREMHSIVSSTSSVGSWVWCIFQSPLAIIIILSVLLLIFYLRHKSKGKFLSWRKRTQ